MARILHVIPYFVPAYGFGGPVTVCLDLAATQVALGHDVTVATTDALDADSRVGPLQEVIEGVNVVRFRNVSAALSKRRNLFMPRGLRAWVRGNVHLFDVAHLHDYFTYLNVCVGALCRERGVPYVVQPHGVAAPPPDQKLYRVKQAFGALWGKELLRGARKILAVSEIERERLDRYLPELKERIAIVGNGLRIEHAPPVTRDRARFGLDESHKVILSLGRLHETKGFDRLLRAFARLVAADPSYRLLIAGSDNGVEGALHDLVRELRLADRVRFLGLVTGEAKEHAFRAADVFALLARYESFSLAVIEALHHGLPVVLSRDVGVASQLVPFDCSVIARDPEDAAVPAVDLSQAFARRAALAANARPTADRFDIRGVVRAVLGYYGVAAAA
jgi:glycosyltransferase involved in cell wall biosynthesis